MLFWSCLHDIYIFINDESPNCKGSEKNTIFICRVEIRKFTIPYESVSKIYIKNINIK